MTTMLESLNRGLHQAMQQDPNVILLGEDLLDPYGGAFKVSRGLSDAFTGRVLTTPISEAGFVGLAAGMALRGLRPVVEIMFGDFLTLAADQLINHAAKFPWMYSGGKAPEYQVRVPLVVRTPMGGRRGYGPTHSQTLEKHFLGTPGLQVIAPTAVGDPGSLLCETVLATEKPVLFVENKLLYLQPVRPASLAQEFEIETTPGPNPAYTLRLRGAPPASLTLAAYGYSAELALQAGLRLAYENEIIIELVIPTLLAPFHIEPILASASRTGRLITVEEGGYTLGWGAEIVAQAAENLGSRLRQAQRLAGADLPIPASTPAELKLGPSVQSILDSCLQFSSQPGAPG